MTTPDTNLPSQPRRRGRSAENHSVPVSRACRRSRSISTLALDQILHVLKIYPPWGQTMSDGTFQIEGQEFFALNGVNWELHRGSPRTRSPDVARDGARDRRPRREPCRCGGDVEQ